MEVVTDTFNKKYSKYFRNIDESTISEEQFSNRLKSSWKSSSWVNDNESFFANYLVNDDFLLQIIKNSTLPDFQKDLALEEFKRRWQQYKIAKEKFLQIVSGRDLAVFFELKYQSFLSTIGLLKFNNQKKYSEFTIPKKSGGTRIINSPNQQLLHLQRKLNFILNLFYDPPKAAHGFINKIIYKEKVSSRSIVSNAKSHSGRKLILNFDLEDFFPSITGNRIFSFFRASPFNFNKEVAGLLTEICCDPNIKGLPQGAATSPILSNMIARRLDIKLIHLASKHKLIYTRYADDITFSSNKLDVPSDFLDEFYSVITSEKFKINREKTRQHRYSQKQIVTGLIVNKKANVSRKYIRNVRAILHNIENYGYDKCEEVLNEKYAKSKKGKISLENYLRGRIEFIGNVRGKNKEQDKNDIYNKLKNRFENLVVGPSFEPSPIIENETSNRNSKTLSERMKEIDK